MVGFFCSLVFYLLVMSQLLLHDTHRVALPTCMSEREREEGGGRKRGRRGRKEGEEGEGRKEREGRRGERRREGGTKKTTKMYNTGEMKRTWGGGNRGDVHMGNIRVEK